MQESRAEKDKRLAEKLQLVDQLKALPNSKFNSFQAMITIFDNEDWDHVLTIIKEETGY